MLLKADAKLRLSIINKVYPENSPHAGLAQEGISPEIIQRLMPTEVTEGQAAKFQCRVFGKPTPEIEWYKDDTLIEDNAEGISFDKEDGCEILIIRDASPTDEAEYKVLARNPLGTATSSAELLVEEAVEKPVLMEALKDVQVLVTRPLPV